MVDIVPRATRKNLHGSGHGKPDTSANLDVRLPAVRLYCIQLRDLECPELRWETCELFPTHQCTDPCLLPQRRCWTTGITISFRLAGVNLQYGMTSQRSVVVPRFISA